MKTKIKKVEFNLRKMGGKNERFFRSVFELVVFISVVFVPVVFYTGLKHRVSQARCPEMCPAFAGAIQTT